MLRTFTNVLKNSKKHMLGVHNFSIMTKRPKIFGKKLNLDSATNPELVEADEHQNDYKNVKILQGKFPYMPIDDHPLIPGYARMLNISKELFDKLKEAKVEESNLVISVTKNPEQIEAVQLSMQQIPINFVPNIKNRNEVYDVGCVCEVKLREEKNFGVSYFSFLFYG